MCGIIAYKGKENATEVLRRGLRHLEYRGYDSCGLCILTNNRPILIKTVGTIDNLEKAIKQRQEKGENLESRVGIGHTRWATHGAVTKINAHPHFSSDKSIYVVHNGIIENYEELKKELKNKGYRFVSQTDTEVIPQLIAEYRKKYSFPIACEKAFRRLRGLFACAVLESKTGEIIGVRNGSPLVMGVGKKGFYLASDVPAFLERTNKVIFIDDGEMVYLRARGDYVIRNFLNGKKVKKNISRIHWTKESAEKGNYAHFMLKEIMEIPQVIRNSLSQQKKDIKQAVNLIKKSSKIILVGCGTAGHACLAGKYWFASLLGKDCDFLPASEFSYFEKTLTKDTLILAISQSGETIDVLEAVRKAKKKKVKVLSLVNVMGSTLTRISDVVLMVQAGPEKCVLATKSYLAQLSVLLRLIFAVLKKEKYIITKLKALSRLLADYLHQENNLRFLQRLATQLSKSEHIYAIGRGINYPTALETALKIKEGTYIHTEGFAGGELKHGVIALIEKGTPCIVHLAEDQEQENTIINAMELKSRGAYLIGIGSPRDNIFSRFVFLKPPHPLLSPLTNIVPIQLLAYYLALQRGINPDKPRNLAKSVTVK